MEERAVYTLGIPRTEKYMEQTANFASKEDALFAAKSLKLGKVKSAAELPRHIETPVLIQSKLPEPFYQRLFVESDYPQWFARKFGQNEKKEAPMKPKSSKNKKTKSTGKSSAKPTRQTKRTPPKKKGPKKSTTKLQGRLKTRAKKAAPTKTKGGGPLTKANQRIKRLTAEKKAIKATAEKKIKRLQNDKKALKKDVDNMAARSKNRKNKPSSAAPLFAAGTGPNWTFANGGPSPMLRAQPVIIPEAVEARAETALALRSDSSLTVEKKAEALTAGKGRLATAVRAVGSRRALKITAVESLAFGLIDSTSTFAQIEEKSVEKTGIGWKGWVGGVALLGAVGFEAWAESAQTPEQFISRSEGADFAANLAIPALGFELYNLGVTRFGRVKAVLEGKNPLELEESDDDEADEEEEVNEAKGLARRIAKKALVRKISGKTVNPDNLDQVAALIGLPPDEAEALYEFFSDDDDDDDDDDDEFAGDFDDDDDDDA